MCGIDRNTSLRMVAIIAIFATIAVSCKNKIQEIAVDNIKNSPTQQVDSMLAVQTKNGRMEMRMFAPTMQRYTVSKDSSYEYFPTGLYVYGYNSDGLLETEITSKEAKHTLYSKNEEWSAFGEVVIKNYIKGEKVETDTLYWDRENKRIFTDCYVKLSSPQGMLQGYGLESDEMARNAVLLRPFDSYVVNKDTTNVNYVDSANFIGPFYKR
jgi:LPS export ABC transporter protein LptC